MVKMNTIIKLFVVIMILALTETMIFTLIETTSGTSIQTAGWRSSEYGYQSDPVYLIDVANQMAAKFPGSSPGGVYVVGEIYGAPGNTSTTYLSFPKPAGTYPNITFETTDKNEAMLTAFDNAGLRIWLQVEPADANVSTLIDLVLNQYGNHSSVKGFGVDVEWLNQKANKNGRKVTDEEVTSWVAQVKDHNTNYKLFLKHWDYNYMPNIRPDGVVYITDSENLGSYDAAIAEYVDWANHFTGSDIGYQIGYPSDQSWWGALTDPAKTIGDAISAGAPGARIDGIYWVDFTIRTAFPPNDTTVPVITSVVLNKVVVNTGASITVTVKATDNTAVTGVTANGTVLQYIRSSNVWRGTIIAQAGTHTVMVSAKDAAGNIAWNNSTSYTATTPDTTKPVINSITLSNTTPYRGAAIIVTVNATDNVGVTVVTANGTALTNLSNNIWSGTIIAESGNHYVKVSAKDAAGNVAWNNTTGYIATTPPDTTAPVITSVVLNNVVVNTGASITVTVKSTDNTAVTGVNANGTVLQYIRSSNVWRGTITAQAGTHTVMVSAKDAAGNTVWNNTTSYTATTPVGSISGYVINDTNRNGRVNNGETGISGWNITISGTGLSLVISTDSAGYYKFGNLPAGTYTITEESKTGWIATGQIRKVISLGSGKNQTNTNFTNARVS